MAQKNGRQKTGAVAQLERAGLASPMPCWRADRRPLSYSFQGSFICILYKRDLESSRRHKITNNANTIVITEKPRALSEHRRGASKLDWGQKAGEKKKESRLKNKT